MVLNHSKGIRIGERKNVSKLEESLEDRTDLQRQHMGCTGVTASGVCNSHGGSPFAPAHFLELMPNSAKNPFGFR